MQKLLALLFTSLFVFSACTSSSIETVEVTGEFHHYTSEAPTAYSQTALDRVCMTPAQLDLTNEGAMFCFTNTEEALEALGSETGVASISIQNLTSDRPEPTRADECFANGTCEFNEAEFVELLEML